MTILEDKGKNFEDMLNFALLPKHAKHLAEMKKWTKKAKGEYREHQF
jgi:hypothetical protein